MTATTDSRNRDALDLACDVFAVPEADRDKPVTTHVDDETWARWERERVEQAGGGEGG